MALDVLADALLERSAIRPPWPEDRTRTERQQERDKRRSREYVLEQAWEWASCAARETITSIDQLRQLRALLDAGLITLADFNRCLGVVTP